MIQVERAIVEKLGFDLEKAVAEYIAALEAHKRTTDQPAPTAHPLVEEIVRKGGTFEIIDSDPRGEPIPPSRIETMEARMNDLEARLAAVESRTTTVRT